MPVTLHDLIYELPNSETLGKRKRKELRSKKKQKKKKRRRNRDEHPRRVSPGSTVVSGSRYS